MKIADFSKNMLIGLYRSIRRFPVTIALSASVVTMLIMMSEIRLHTGFAYSKMEILERVTMILALGLPLSLCIQLIFERYGKLKNSVKVLTYILAGGFLVFYYFFLLKNFRLVPVSRYVALNFALYLLFLCIPYLNKRDHFELYVIKVFSRFFITVIYSVVLFLGLAAILFTVNKLFGVSIHHTLYYYTWLLTAGIFAPVFFLAGVPEFPESLADYSYPKFFKILLLYIVMPLIMVYHIILYIYFAKIIITRAWPVGLVSHLVLWYSTLTVAVMFLISPIKNNGWVDRFIFWLPKFILPILIMMFVSIGIRINAYGITENRYYVVVLGLWVLAIMLYFNLSRVKRNILIPASLSLVFILAVFGPVSGFSISKYSQNHRLAEILTRNGMLQNNRVVPANAKIAEKDKREISNILNYFANNHSLQDVKYLEKDFTLKDMEKVFGFPYQYEDPYSRGEKYFSYHVEQQFEPVEITGYDYLFDFRMMKNPASHEKLRIIYDHEAGEVQIFLNNEAIYQFRLSDFAAKLHDKYPNQGPVEPKDMVVVDENENVKVKFIFFSIFGSQSPAGDGIKVNDGEFYLLLRLKK